MKAESRELGWVILAGVIGFVLFVAMVWFSPPAFGQVSGTLVPPGCWVAFNSPGGCYEPEDTPLWSNYGRQENIYFYGMPVGRLLNQAVDDRALLEEWIAYGRDQHAKARSLANRVRWFKRRCGGKCK